MFKRHMASGCLTGRRMIEALSRQIFVFYEKNFL